MHIIWVNQHASLVGGAEHYIANTARHLRTCGIYSTLLYDPNLPTSPDMLGAFDEAFPWIDGAHQIPMSRADLVFLHQTRDPRIIARLEGAQIPVVEFLHDHWLFCLRVHKYTTLRKKTCEKPANAASCYSCLGFVQRQAEFPHLRWRTISDLQNEHRLRNHFAGFITGSTYMANQAIAHGFGSNKVHVAPLYAELPNSIPDGQRREDMQLLYVGAILPYKGIDILINSLRYTTSPMRLDIIGDGSFTAECKRMVEQFGLGERVRFLGRLKPATISNHYRRATCLVLPSRTPESFGIVGAEAMSHALPAIVSNIGGALEWLEPGRTGLTFPTNDARGLAKAIDIVSNSPTLVREMGHAARERYHQYFRPEHHVARLQHIFRSLLPKRGLS